MRSLATGEKGFEKYPKILAKNFVFLNEYTTSVQAEHDPRGPEGPYRFVDRSVPVVLFKRWDGETLDTVPQSKSQRVRRGGLSDRNSL